MSGTTAGDEPTDDELAARAVTDPGAREAMVLRFTPLAEHLARRFAGRSEHLEDLQQVAQVGLLGAIDRFDPGREVQFSTFAAATIVGELKRHLRDKGWAVRVPRSLQEQGLATSRASDLLTQELGRAPTVPEIAERVGTSAQEVLEAMDAMSAYSAGSLDAPVGDEGPSASETLGGEDESIELIESWSSIAPAVAELPERSRRVLYLRFFRGLTQSEIAEVIGVSQMHVSRILTRALTQLRESAEPP